MLSAEKLMKVIDIQAELARQGMRLNSVMQTIVEEVLLLLDADGAVVELVEGDELVYRAVSGIVESYLGFRLPVSDSLSGTCVRTGEILLCEDSELDERVNLEACRKIGLRSMIVFPICFENKTVGIIKALSKQPNKFEQSDIALVGMLSGVIAATMHFSFEYGGDNLFYQATHDVMTGLANRAIFMDRLNNLSARVSQEKKQFAAVLMIDMDGLKQLNDEYGHRVGDAAIIEFAARLKRTIRESDTLARLGGDEFAIILASAQDQNGVDKVVTRINQELAIPFSFEDESYMLRASIGCAQLPADGLNAAKVLETADQRMYKNKQQRKAVH